MKKYFKQILLCLRLWLIKRMGYKLQSLREVTPVMPGQLYDHFGYVVQFTCRKKKSEETHVTELGEIPEHCFLCPLYKKGIPCTFNHRMANGKDICDDYSLEIIIKNTGNI